MRAGCELLSDFSSFKTVITTWSGGEWPTPWL